MKRSSKNRSLRKQEEQAKKGRTLRAPKRLVSVRKPRARPAREGKPASPLPKAGREPARFPIVGIGASAGGLEALEKFLGEVEPTSGAAYVVVTHQAPGRTTLLPELLAKHTKLNVQVAGERTRLRPNQVYVSPPGCCLAIQDEILEAIPVDSAD